MALKTYDELTFRNKVMLLHRLHPQDIKALLIFMAEHLKWLLRNGENIIIDCDVTDGPSWSEVAQSLLAHIDGAFDTLAANPYHFADTFTTGKNQFLFLNGLTSYTTKCENEHFRKAIDYLFDF